MYMIVPYFLEKRYSLIQMRKAFARYQSFQCSKAFSTTKFLRSIKPRSLINMAKAAPRNRAAFSFKKQDIQWNG
jgi:hypothetical protein